MNIMDILSSGVSAIAGNPLGMIAMIAGIMFLILIHEFGHWIVARVLGFQTPVFAIGFGKREWSLVLGKFWDTEFRLSPILLGGYVSIPELQDETTAREVMKGELKEFKFFPVWKRMAVAVAGVTMNVIFTIVAIAMLFSFIGKPQLDVTGTIVGGLDTQVTIARDAGLQPGDKFVTIGGASIKTPDDLMNAVRSHKNQPVEVVVERNGAPVAVTLTPNADGKVGIKIDVQSTKTYQKMGVWDATKAGAAITWDITGKMLSGLGQMVSNIYHKIGMALGLMPPAQIGDDVHGIVGIVSVGSQAFDSGAFDFIWILAMISLNLAVLNILPIPMLDGGHMLFFSIEGIFRRPVPLAIRQRLSSIFVMLLLGLMVYGLINDIVNPLVLPK